MKTLNRAVNELREYDGRKIKIMEVCGTHTASIFKNGIRTLISPKIELISGPGCPVCVTSAPYIDKLIEYSLSENYAVLTFGDMMKVKGSRFSLTESRAQGGKAEIVYSPLSAVKTAQEDPNTQYVFAAVGFETTAPVYALMLDEMIQNNIKNLKLLTSVKTILPAISYICENEKNIDAFLCPGHVSVITGCDIYRNLADQYKKPFVVSGFEGEHIISAVYEIVHQIRKNEFCMKNMYPSAVTGEGNLKALALIDKYFERKDDTWRGIGKIPNSGLKLREEYLIFDAGSDFENADEKMPKGCKCRDVILGRINPIDCPLFKTACSPLNAVGPCMVSLEGACGIWYKNNK